MIHFSQLTKEQVSEMILKAEMAAVQYAEEINMAGLSHLGSHNIYSAIQEGIFGEWKSAKAWAKNLKDLRASEDLAPPT